MATANSRGKQMDERALMIVLRLFHIVGGVVWVGGMTLLAWFLLPAAQAVGPEGGKVLQQVMIARRLRMWMALMMGATVLSGLWLFARNISAAGGSWASTGAGMGYSLGALAAIVAGIIGMGIGARAGRRMAVLGQEMAQAGGRPSEAQMAEMQRLQRLAGTTTKVVSVLLLFAAAAMAAARYLP